MSDNSYVEFALPNDDWRELTPPPGQLFFAARVGEFERFVPSLLVGGSDLAPGETVEMAADRLLEDARQQGQDTQLAKRDVQAPEGQPARVLQAFTLSLTIGEFDVRVGQFQTLIEVRERLGDRRGVLVFTLSAEADQIHNYLDDYQAFIASAKAVTTDAPDAP